MLSTLAETMPVAVTLAASPVPILAVIVMLVTQHGSASIAAVLVVVAIVLAVHGARIL